MLVSTIGNDLFNSVRSGRQGVKISVNEERCVVMPCPAMDKAFFLGGFQNLELNFKAQIMDQQSMERTLVRISHQIIEKNHGVENLCLIGIKTRGIPLAKKIAENIQSITSVDVPVGELDITLYRDDLSAISESAIVSNTIVPFSIKDKTVVLVDDVIFTCRTARAALDAIMAIGRPAKIQLFCMIDRGHAELPIKADFVGKNIPTSLSEVVSVKLFETDGEMNVSIYEKQ